MVVKICSCNLLFSNIIYLGKTEPHPTQTTRPIQVAKGSHGKQRDLCITRIFNPGFFFFFFIQKSSRCRVVPIKSTVVTKPCTLHVRTQGLRIPCTCLGQES